MIRLTARQLECLRLRCRGLSGVQIADRLFVSERTVRGHLTDAYAALGIGSLVDPAPRNGTKDAFACYLLGMADAAFVIDAGDVPAMRTWQV